MIKSTNKQVFHFWEPLQEKTQNQTTKHFIPNIYKPRIVSTTTLLILTWFLLLVASTFGHIDGYVLFRPELDSSHYQNLLTGQNPGQNPWLARFLDVRGKNP